MYHNWSAIEENMLLGVPKVVGWLVWIGLMSAFQIMCEILEKTNTFLISLVFLLGSMSPFPQNSCLSWLDLAFLWPKVPKNHGIPKIRVFLHPETLKFHGVGELSCRGHKLKIWC